MSAVPMRVSLFEEHILPLRFGWYAPVIGPPIRSCDEGRRRTVTGAATSLLMAGPCSVRVEHVTGSPGNRGALAYCSAAALGSRGWPLFLHERIQSTRSLERFRNGVLLRRAVDWAWFDVVDVFEDCHRLMALG